MPFWKAKKKEIPSDRVMMCPKCNGKKLRYMTSGGMIFSHPSLYCPDCGYKGHVYVDIEPNNDHEDDMEQFILEDNPEFIETRQSAKDLACQTLKSKWIPSQQNNNKPLRDWCPFCADVQVVCSICRCPPEICRNHATEGLIGELNALYDDETLLKDVDSEIYGKIVQGFQSLCNE